MAGARGEAGRGLKTRPIENCVCLISPIRSRVHIHKIPFISNLRGTHGNHRPRHPRGPRLLRPRPVLHPHRREPAGGPQAAGPPRPRGTKEAKSPEEEPAHLCSLGPAVFEVEAHRVKAVPYGAIGARRITAQWAAFILRRYYL